jgi:1,4-alpha-glucan branching enzyme
LSSAAPPAAKSDAAPVPRPAKPVHVPRERLAPDHEVQAVVTADHRDPFGFLGMHRIEENQALVVRCFAPEAKSVEVIEAATGRKLAGLERLHEDGLFGGPIAGRSEWFPYRLRIETAIGASEIDDPYRFPPILGEADVLRLAEGDHLDSYRTLGAHARTMEGVTGTAFTVWAPQARRVAVIGEFNNWDGRCHGMRLRHDCGVWEIFLPAVVPGQLYKYEIKSGAGVRLTDKCDPYAFQVERLPGTAAIVTDLDRFRWSDSRWMEARAAVEPHRAPISIYEVHLASWRRKPEDGHRCLSYRELAEELVAYVDYMQFSHVQLLPIGEYDLDASHGYQPFAPYAPTSRFGSPDDFRILVDQFHERGIGVILDWVPVHFSDDPHGLRAFDGSHLYEPADPRQRHLPGSSLLTYDFARREVANYLLSNALFWLDTYHIDALHIGDLARILYLDYGRARGEWEPNRFGGQEYLEAIDFLRRLNQAVYGRFPGAFSIAEETSGWPRLSHPTFLGGLGFGFKWHPNWAREVLRYLSRNPVHRKYYHDEIVQGSATVFNENHVLPLSHEHVASGRGSLLRRMPGDQWSRFANLRLFYAFIYTHPGKKLMFMGNEFAQEREWDSGISLDWHLAEAGPHAGIKALVRDLNILYRTTPALYEGDCAGQGFTWIDCADADQGVIAFLRSPVRAVDPQAAEEDSAGKETAARAPDEAAPGPVPGPVIVVCHFTPVVRRGYRIGVPAGGFWEERLNTDAERYGGTNQGNAGGIEAEAQPAHGHPFSLRLTLPPFAAVVLEQRP